jgi:hypothetical protein
VLGKLSHERLAKSSDLSIGLALGVKVGTSLATTHVKASQGILEDLLETKELEDRQVDTGVESKTALVGTKSRVELDTETSVDLEVTLVVAPNNTELNDTLRNGGNSKGSAVLGVLVVDGAVLEGRGELAVSLLELGLLREVRHGVQLHLGCISKVSMVDVY